MNKDLEQRIRDRAHQLWEQDGQSHGRAEDHWREAERELTGGAEVQGSDVPMAGSKVTRKPRTAQVANKTAAPDAAEPQVAKPATRRKKQAS